MCRKFLLFLFFGIFSTFLKAQESSFGVTAGYLNAQLKTNSNTTDISEDISGFYLGGLIDIELSESIHLGLGANYANSENADLLYISVLPKYYIAESGFYVQAGPQASFLFLKNSNAEFETVGIDAGLGAGYKINEQFFVEMKYFFGLTNRLDRISETNDLKLNSLMVGLGYKF